MSPIAKPYPALRDVVDLGRVEDLEFAPTLSRSRVPSAFGRTGHPGVAVAVTREEGELHPLGAVAVECPHKSCDLREFGRQLPDGSFRCKHPDYVWHIDDGDDPEPVRTLACVQPTFDIRVYPLVFTPDGRMFTSTDVLHEGGDDDCS